MFFLLLVGLKKEPKKRMLVIYTSNSFGDGCWMAWPTAHGGCTPTGAVSSTGADPLLIIKVLQRRFHWRCCSADRPAQTRHIHSRDFIFFVVPNAGFWPKSRPNWRTRCGAVKNSPALWSRSKGTRTEYNATDLIDDASVDIYLLSDWPPFKSSDSRC